MEVSYQIKNRSELEFSYGDKKMIIQGEIIVSPSAFNVYFLSIRNWLPPFEKEEISDGEKYRIIKALIEESQKEGNIRLYFD